MYNINSKKPFSYWSSLVGYHASATLATHLNCTAQSGFLSIGSLKTRFKTAVDAGTWWAKVLAVLWYCPEKKLLNLVLVKRAYFRERNVPYATAPKIRFTGIPNLSLVFYLVLGYRFELFVYWLVLVIFGVCSVSTGKYLVYLKTWFSVDKFKKYKLINKMANISNRIDFQVK